MQREFKRSGHCVARMRVQFPGAKQTTNNIVQDAINGGGRDLVEGLMILAATQGAEGICLGMEAFVLLCHRDKKAETEFHLQVAAERGIHAHSRRQECLMAAYQMPDREVQAMAMIHRDPTRLGNWELTETLEGHYDEFLAEFPQGESKFGFIYRKAKQADKVEWIADLLTRARLFRGE